MVCRIPDAIMFCYYLILYVKPCSQTLKHFVFDDGILMYQKEFWLNDLTMILIKI